MKYDLVQYGCDKCGELTPVMDPDEKMPEGWVVLMPFDEERHKYRHLCPKCAKELLLGIKPE